MSTHPTKRLIAPDGEEADIDVALVPLIGALWLAGYETVTCCQDLGESIGAAEPRKSAYWKGYALLELPVADARRLVNTVRQRARFRDRFHWAAEGAWDMSIPVVVLGHEGAAIAPWIQIHFPAGQTDDLTAVVTSQRRR